LENIPTSFGGKNIKRRKVDENVKEKGEKTGDRGNLKLKG
jgi:hypothetical protein